MKKYLAATTFLLALFAVAKQYLLMQANSDQSTFETTIRFFSYFTILTNTMVAIYFGSITLSPFFKQAKSSSNFSKLSSITLYITIVGIVYQILLRSLWNPTGMQHLVDELLHTVIPLLVLVYWWLSKKGQHLFYQQIPFWLLYPLLYLVFVLVRGQFSNFYPYPFLQMPTLGRKQVLVNSLVMTLLFVLIATLLVRISRQSAARKNAMVNN